MLAFLVLLLVSLATLTRVETQVASNSQNVVKRVLPIKRRGANRLVQLEGRATTVAIRKQQRPSPEAEAAKERVLFALQIAGATLNDAQKAIQDSGPKDKPEPLSNR